MSAQIVCKGLVEKGGGRGKVEGPGDIYSNMLCRERERALELLIKCSVLFYENCGSYPALSINIPVRFLFFLSLFPPPLSILSLSLFLLLPLVLSYNPCRIVSLYIRTRHVFRKWNCNLEMAKNPK